MDRAKQDGYEVGVVETEEASGLRSQRCVDTIASKCGTMASTMLGLRPPLHLGM